jgi:hypothetical protein
MSWSAPSAITGKALLRHCSARSVMPTGASLRELEDPCLTCEFDERQWRFS